MILPLDLSNVNTFQDLEAVSSIPKRNSCKFSFAPKEKKQTYITKHFLSVFKAQHTQLHIYIFYSSLFSFFHIIKWLHIMLSLKIRYVFSTLPHSLFPPHSFPWTSHKSLPRSPETEVHFCWWSALNVRVWIMQMLLYIKHLNLVCGDWDQSTTAQNTMNSEGKNGLIKYKPVPHIPNDSAWLCWPVHLAVWMITWLNWRDKRPFGACAPRLQLTDPFCPSLTMKAPSCTSTCLLCYCTSAEINACPKKSFR